MTKETFQETLCIFCGKNLKNGLDHKITKEHIIPKVLGGWIKFPFVCAKCNNKFLGGNIVKILKRNIFIATAIKQLNITSAKEAYRHARLEVILDKFPSEKLIAYFDNKGRQRFFPKNLSDGSLLVEDPDLKSVLEKKIKKFEKISGRKIDFNINDFENIPTGIIIPISGTNINFIKHHKSMKSKITISELDKPIPFRIPAIIAFEHLAAFIFPEIYRPEFTPIAEWILNIHDQNRYVVCHTFFENYNPLEVKYLPYHYIRLDYKDDILSAVVVIFGFLVYSVFIAKINNLKYTFEKDLFDYYYIYDINNRKVYKFNPPQILKEEHAKFIDTVSTFGLYENKHYMKNNK